MNYIVNFFKRLFRKSKIKLFEKTTYFIESSSQTYIPEDYVENPKERLALYTRMASFEIKHDVVAFLKLEDRYGTVPEVVSLLCETIKSQLSVLIPF